MALKPLLIRAPFPSPVVLSTREFSLELLYYVVVVVTTQKQTIIVEIHGRRLY